MSDYFYSLDMLVKDTRWYDHWWARFVLLAIANGEQGNVRFEIDQGNAVIYVN